MQLPLGHKFAAFFLSRAFLGDDVGDEQQVEPNFWVARRLGLGVTPTWETWLGSLLAEEAEADGFAMYAVGPSAHPLDFDADYEPLRQRLFDALNGLLIQGVPEYVQGIHVIGGYDEDGKVKIRRMGNLNNVLPTWGLPEFRPKFAEVRRAILLSHRLRFIQGATDGHWGRILRGVRVLLQANRQTNEYGERVHQMVRAIEAVIKPQIGNTRNQFAHRGQTMAVANALTREILLELFDVRSAVEHLHLPHSAAVGETDNDRIARVNRLTRQADVMARFILCHILESQELFIRFRTDQEIDEFWAIEDDSRIKIWDQRIDIAAVP